MDVVSSKSVVYPGELSPFRRMPQASCSISDALPRSEHQTGMRSNNQLKPKRDLRASTMLQVCHSERELAVSPSPNFGRNFFETA